MTGFFLNPGFLWLLPLAGLPVLFHFFARMKKKVLPFSTFMFFQRIDPRLNAMRRIREWLLLALRVLVIAAAVLALAGPRWEGSGSGGKTAVVIVVDNSGSMGEASGRMPAKLDEALAAAEAVVASLGPGDPVGLVTTCEDTTASLPAGLTTDRAAVRAALRRLAPTDAAGRPGEALQKAFGLLKNASSGHREVHVVTDLQENEWGRQPAAQSALASVGVFFHRVMSKARREANVAVNGMEVPARRLVAGRPVRVQLRLGNASDARADVTLKRSEDGGTPQVEGVTFNPGEEKIVTLVTAAQTPGLHWLDVRVEGDGFKADNHGAVAMVAGGREPVVFVGKEGDFGLLPRAIAPMADGSMSGLVPVFVPANGMAAILKEKRPAMIVVTWPVLAAMGVVDRNVVKVGVEAGATLLVVPALAPGDVAKGLPDWVPGRPEKLEVVQAGAPIAVFRKGDALLADLRNEKGEVLLRNLRALRFCPLALQQSGASLMGLEDGRPLLSVHALGRGAIVLSGLAFDPDWSNLPLKGGFLALAQGMALLRLAAPAEAESIVAGNRPALPATVGRSVSLKGISTDVPLEWRGEPGRLPGIPRAGVYALESGTNTIYVAVRADPSEGAARYVEGDQVPVAAGIRHEVRTWDDADGMLAWVKRHRLGIDFMGPLFLICLALFLGEGWLGSTPPMKGKMDKRGGSLAEAERNAEGRVSHR